MSSDRSRREVKARGCDAQRMNALEQLKRARQGGQATVVEEPAKNNESEEEEEEDDFGSDSNDYEDIKSSSKRKSSTTHRKDSKRLKKKSRPSDEDEEEEEEEESKSTEPKRRGQVLAKPEEESIKTHDIKSMFAASKARHVQKQEQNNKDDSDKLLSDIMFELQKPKNKQTRPAPQPAPVKPQPPPPPRLAQPQSKPVEISLPEEKKTPVITTPDPSVGQEKELDWGDDDSMSFDAVSKLMNDAAAPTKVLSPPRASKSLIQFDTQELEFVTDEQLLKSARTFHTSPSKETDLTANKDEHLSFFWFDAYEDPVAQPGKLFLFGKTPLINEDKSVSSKTFVSICLIIDNIPKQVFFIPKVGCSASDIEDELFIIAKRFKITNYTSAIVKKKRFDPDLIITDVLNEVDVVEMKYPARCATLPSDLKGDSFQCVYGANQTALEYILIDRKLKGPCWLNIKNCAPVKTRRSWCKLEYDVDYYHSADRQMSNIEIGSSGSAPPPLVAVTLSLVTLANSKTHETEVVCVAGLVHQQFPMDGPAPKRPYQNYFVALTKPTDCILPPGLAKAAETQKINIETVPGERALLMYLISKFQLLDPDVIIGHDMRMFGLELFLSRCQKLKVGLTASKICRLHRTHDGKTRISAIKNPTCGRLLCDISVSARELLTKCKSYDLEELCKTVLNRDQQQLYRHFSIDQTREAFSSAMSVVDLVQATLNNTSLILNIFCQLMVLPLAYQLTCIAGNLLSRTLAGGRSERNDHLLLHAFTERDYIVPERTMISNSRTATKHTQENHHESDEEADDEAKKTKSSSTSYAGGLVLAPKKGFYDHFILLLDFNSLYPSIIQEFNVCFTTYTKKPLQSRSNNETEQTEVDDIVAIDETNKGILPLEIYKLVERRREVKKLIKEKKNLSDEQLAQYDIRQKAYKLTANSLYGCLGFKYSRFYCKSLAAFITYKGREILMQAKNIVERMNFDVIYGDTDSIMINTNSVDYDQVIAIGAKIRNEINRLYKNVEIGIDGVFKSMLLLKKKKYAARIIEKTPTQEFVERTELKGLDIVRRDWCQLARKIGESVVDVILSGGSRDDVLDKIHNSLRDLGENMRAGKIDIEQYEINRQLSKDPSDYSDAKSLPHVLIAVRYNAHSTGRKMKRGDTIAYIVCEDGTQNSAMQRGYLREEILSSTSPQLTIDINYYLHQQILPVVSRLLEPFDGTDQAYIAQCLGLDSSKYKQRQQKQYGSKENENYLDQNDENDHFDDELVFGEGSEAFKHCDPFAFPCAQCQTLNFWNAPLVFNEDKTCASPLLRCVNVNCSSQPIDHVPYLRNRLTLMINKAVRRYYQNWLRCEDDTCCAFRTRQTPLSVLHKRHTCTSCGKSDLITEYDDRQLNLQLRFLKQLFNFDAYKQCLNRTKAEQMDVYMKSLSNETNRSMSKTMNELQTHIDRMVQKSGYAEVCISSLFAQFYFNV